MSLELYQCLTAIAAILSAVAVSATVIIAAVTLPGIAKDQKRNILKIVLDIEVSLRHIEEVIIDKTFRLKQSIIDNQKDKITINREALKGSQDLYLLQLDRLCFCILKGYVQAEDWKAEYQESISNTIQQFGQYFRAGSPYDNIIKLNEKWESNGKRE